MAYSYIDTDIAEALIDTNQNLAYIKAIDKMKKADLLGHNFKHTHKIWQQQN